nr:hypothetical protein [Candidatus Enterousia merdequi]
MKKSLMLALVLVAIGVVGTAFAFYGPWVRPEPGISCTHEIATMGYETACEIHPECCE